jgi:hypothetical protein
MRVAKKHLVGEIMARVWRIFMVASDETGDILSKAKRGLD